MTWPGSVHTKKMSLKAERKDPMKKTLALVLALCLLMMTAAFGMAETADDSAEALSLMDSVKGTYEPLFPVITAPEYDRIWLDACGAVLGEEAAPAAAEMLKAACTGTVYGRDAVDAYGDGSNGARFDCLFIGGVSRITFDGLAISGENEAGETVFSYEYTYAGPLSLGGMMDGWLFETADENAGEFRYFYMMPDTPATTYHLEFRYGADKEDLTKYNEGPYAYWLAAGFPVDADEEMIRNVITLFCLENMDYSTHTEEALAQLAELGLPGTWQADMAPFGEAYADVELMMTIDEKGHGTTLMNGQQTADFEAYALDSGEKGDGIGIYVAFSNTDGEAEDAPFVLTVDEQGRTVLTLTADDGTISWVKQAAE